MLLSEDCLRNRLQPTGKSVSAKTLEGSERSSEQVRAGLGNVVRVLGVCLIMLGNLLAETQDFLTN